MKTLIPIILIIVTFWILLATQPPQPETDDLGLPYRNDMQQFNQYPR